MIPTRSTYCLLKQVQIVFEDDILAEMSKGSFKFPVGVNNKPKRNKISFVEKLDQFLDEKKNL